MPIVSVPIAQLPVGVVSTNAELALISVLTLSENAVVRTLGASAINDGGAGVYYFVAGSSATTNGLTVLATPTTGRWIAAAPSFSGLGPITASYSGVAESLVIASGFAPVVYTLPVISTSPAGQTVTIVTATTGTITIRPGNGTDLMMNAGAVSSAVTSTLTGGQAFTFQNFANRWWLLDRRWGL